MVSLVQVSSTPSQRTKDGGSPQPHADPLLARAQATPPHISVDLLDREGTTKAFSSLNKVTDLVFAAYVEKRTMAETVEPNARMLTNALDALGARNLLLQRIVLAGGAKSYGFHLGAFNAPAKETEPRLIAPIHYHQQEDIVAEWADCTYYSIPIGGSKSEYAVWTYEKAYEAVASIKEYLAFYPSRVDAIEVISYSP
jgi:Domain of unknown function (DUF427)